MFKNTIKESRQKRGLSQTKLACQIGLASTTMSNLELGKLKPWPKVKKDIARALNTTEQELFSSET